MRKLVKALAIVSAMALGACVAPTYNVRPQPVLSQADTYRFRVFPTVYAIGGSLADWAVEDEVVKFRVANGYASSEILGRDYQDSAFVYTVKFTR